MLRRQHTFFNIKDWWPGDRADVTEVSSSEACCRGCQWNADANSRCCGSGPALRSVLDAFPSASPDPNKRLKTVSILMLWTYQNYSKWLTYISYNTTWLSHWRWIFADFVGIYCNFLPIRLPWHQRPCQQCPAHRRGQHPPWAQKLRSTALVYIEVSPRPRGKNHIIESTNMACISCIWASIGCIWVYFAYVWPYDWIEDQFVGPRFANIRWLLIIGASRNWFLKESYLTAKPSAKTACDAFGGSHRPWANLCAGSPDVDSVHFF